MNTNKDAYKIINNLHSEGLPWHKIASRLNEMGVKTATGKSFKAANASSVYFYWQGAKSSKQESTESIYAVDQIRRIVNSNKLTATDKLKFLKTFLTF